MGQIHNANLYSATLFDIKTVKEKAVILFTS